MFEALSEALRSPEGLLLAAEDHITALRARADQLSAETGDLDRETSQLTERKTKLALLWADGNLPEERWRSEKARLDRQIAEVEGRATGVASGLKSLGEVRWQL